MFQCASSIHLVLSELLANLPPFASRADMLIELQFLPREFAYLVALWVKRPERRMVLLPSGNFCHSPNLRECLALAAAPGYVPVTRQEQRAWENGLATAAAQNMGFRALCEGHLASSLDSHPHLQLTPGLAVAPSHTMVSLETPTHDLYCLLEQNTKASVWAELQSDAGFVVFFAAFLPDDEFADDKPVLDSDDAEGIFM